MRTIIIIIFVVSSINLQAQNYKITGAPGERGVESLQGKQILNKEYEEIFECTNSDNHVVVRKEDNIWLVNTETSEFIKLDDYFEDNYIEDDKCKLTKKDKFKYFEKKKVGLYQFPQTKILPAEYKEVRLIDGYNKACLLENNGLYSIYNYNAKHFSVWFKTNDPYIHFNIDNDRVYSNEDSRFPAKYNQRWHLMNLKEEVFPVSAMDMEEFDLSEYRANDFYVTWKKWDKKGIVNLKNEVILKPKYEYIHVCDNSKNHVIAYKKDKNFFVNTSTKEIFELKGDVDDWLYDDYKCNIQKGQKIYLSQNNKIGLYEFPQKELLPIEFIEIRIFEENTNTCLVQKGKKLSIYNFTTKKFTSWFTVKDKPRWVFSFDGNSHFPADDAFVANFDNEMYLMNIKGEKFSIEKFDELNFNIEDPSYNYFLTKKDGKYGYMYSDAHIVIDYMYDDANWFLEGIAIVKFNGKYGIIDPENAIVIPFVYDKVELTKDNKIEATYKGSKILFNVYGDPIPDPYPIKKGDKFGYMNDNEEMIIKNQFDYACLFKQSLALVCQGGKYNPQTKKQEGGKWGYIIPTGDLIIDCIYDEAEEFSEGQAKVKKDGKEFYINFQGKCIKDCP